MRDETKRNLRVGALTVASLTVLAVAILVIGERQQLFVRHTKYRTTFRNVMGLKAGAPVGLIGVTVGFVESVELPVDPEQQRIEVKFTVDARYTERIREDTTVAIKTVGLLGDKYLELKGGTASSKRTLEGGLVQGQDPAEMAEFVARGEDVMENVIAISSSLKTILRRVEAGEGLIGELTVSPEAGGRLVESVSGAVAALRTVLERIETGHGLLGRMISDDEIARTLLAELETTARAVGDVATTLEVDLGRDDTVYAALLRDPDGGRLAVETVQALRDGIEALAAATEELASGDGTLPRLMKDREYAEDFLDELHGLISHLRSAAEKLDAGQGTAGAFVNDPQMYQDLENVVRGVRSSKITSWFIRNRRASGEKHAEEEAEAARAAAAEDPDPQSRVVEEQ